MRHSKLFLACVATCLCSVASAQIAETQRLAQDMVNVSNRLCYDTASGSLTVPQNVGEATALMEGMGLQYGVPGPVMDRLGPVASVMLNRTTMASLSRGDAHIVFAAGAQGCRVLLVAKDGTVAAETLAATLGSSANGWRAIPELTATRGALERRVFIRRDARGKPYLMNLMSVIDPKSELRAFTSFAPIPPQVTIPEGY